MKADPIDIAGRAAPPPSAASAARAPDPIAWALMIGLGVIWGGSFATTGAAVAELPPLSVAAARLCLAALILTPLAYLLARGLPDWRGATGAKIWRAAAGCAFAANAAPFALLSWAQTQIPSGLAGVFMATLPLIVLPLAAWFVPGEILSRRKIVGFVIGFCGVAWLLGFDAFSGLGQGGGIALLAQFACLGAALGYGVGSIVTKLSPSVHPVAFGAATMILAAAMLTPVALIAEAPWADPALAKASAAAWSSILFLGVFPTALAVVMLYETLRRAGPSFLSLVNYQVPIWAMLFGALLLGEAIPAQAPLALILILTGVAVSQGAGGRLFGRR